MSKTTRLLLFAGARFASSAVMLSLYHVVIAASPAWGDYIAHTVFWLHYGFMSIGASAFSKGTKSIEERADMLERAIE